jgi:hypothetical protein
MTERDIRYPTEHNGAYSIKCPSCGREGGHSPNLERTVAIWNGTPEPTAADLTPAQAIQCALALDCEGLTFLAAWNEGEFETVEKEFPIYKEFLA